MKKPTPRGRQAGGFTRADFLAISAGVALAGLLAVPLLANADRQSDRAVCINNLGRIGKGFNIWGAENGSNQRPWWVYYSNGGTRPTAGNKPGVTWVEFYTIRSFLDTPQVLLCPSDRERRERWARDWSDSADRGFISRYHREGAVSYFIGLHASFDNPHSLLSGDRNLSTSGQSTCAAGVTPANFLDVMAFDEDTIQWTNNLHGSHGNFLLNSGEVITTSNLDLKDVLTAAGKGYERIHLIIP